MDLGIEMYEVYLIQVAGLELRWLTERGMGMDPGSLADKIIAEIKNKQSTTSVGE